MVELESLTKLDLCSCESLAALPESIGNLKALLSLNLSECSSLVALPAAISELKSLQFLNLYHCRGIATLPDAIGGLTALEELGLTGCSITALPAAIGELKALKYLFLEGCSSLTSLPNAIGELKALTYLNLDGCSSLAALPPAIDAMHWLEVKGGPRSGFACFAELARPRLKATFPILEQQTEDAIDEMISRWWSSVSESRRAKVDDTHDGIAYGEFLVSSLMKVTRMVRRRTCDACGRCGEIEEDRFPVCWCGARRRWPPCTSKASGR